MNLLRDIESREKLMTGDALFYKEVILTLQKLVADNVRLNYECAKMAIDIRLLLNRIKILEAEK